MTSGKLLDRLRGLPPVFGDRAGYTPARIPTVGPNDIDDWDVQGLVNLLTTTIQPDTWEDLSGPGSILMYAPKLVFSIRQTQEVHQEIRNLFTVLRRARYLARRGKTWKSFDIAEGPWFTAVLGVTDIPIGVRQSELPEAETDELKALAVLAEPVPGTQVWRSISAVNHGSPTTTMRQSPARSEFEFEGRLQRASRPMTRAVACRPGAHARRARAMGRSPAADRRRATSLAPAPQPARIGAALRRQSRFAKRPICTAPARVAGSGGGERRATHGQPQRRPARALGEPTRRCACVATQVFRAGAGRRQTDLEKSRCRRPRGARARTLGARFGFAELKAQIPPLEKKLGRFRLLRPARSGTGGQSPLD